MAFLGLFKRKGDNSARAAYKQIHDRIFPMGMEDISRDCQRIAGIVGGKISRDQMQEFVFFCKALVAQMGGPGATDDEIVATFVNHSGNSISAAEARDIFVYFAGEATYRNMIVAARKEDGRPLSADDLANIERKAELWRHGPTSDRVPGGHGDYGFVPSNPVPMIGILATVTYIKRLRYSGRPVEHELLGEADSNVTPAGLVTVLGLSQAGRNLDPIFVYVYSRRNSKLAPAGFTLV
jgi:hypothetical protein